MKLAEMLQIMSDEVEIKIVTLEYDITFIGYKSEFDEAIKQELETEEKTKLINCLDKEIKSIEKGKFYIEIRIKAFIDDIIPEYPEPDLSYRP